MNCTLSGGPTAPVDDGTQLVEQEGVIGRAMQAEDVVYKRALEAIDVGRVSASLLAVYAAARVVNADLQSFKFDVQFN